MPTCDMQSDTNYLCGRLKMAVQRGRSERRGESYSVPYVEPLSDARTMLADFFSIPLSLMRDRV